MDKKRREKTLQTTVKQHRLHFTGALNLDGLKVFIQEYKTIDGTAMVDFFKKLEEKSGASKIHIILDNARAHKNKKVEEYLQNSIIKLHYLHFSAKKLIESSQIELERVYNRYFADSGGFFAEVRSFFCR